MTPLRLFAVTVIFFAASVAWLVLGGVTTQRTASQAAELRGKVADLWGEPQSQAGPTLAFVHVASHDVVRTETVAGVERQVRETVEETQTEDVSLDSTRVAVDLHLDARLKGLMWHALYDVTFHGAWTYLHADPRAGAVRIGFRFPDPSGVYDGFRFTVDGQTRDLRPKDGELQVLVPVTPGQKVSFAVEYKSRGTNEWRYVAGAGVTSLKDFQLTMTTDFADIDYPGGTLSPSTRERRGAGWTLGWTFERVVTGKAIGMTMPQHIQPGELAAALSFSAPVSLLFFFLVLMVLARLRGLDIHPMNYVFLAGAFFAFHLLFAYSVDHVGVGVAFTMASAVSIFLVASYLRLVVSTRFAYVEAGLAQLVYLIGFSLAHFWEGFTGLTVTVLSVLTLFFLMQLTGRIRWSLALGRPAEARA